jgi:hypothetical protein
LHKLKKEYKVIDILWDFSKYLWLINTIYSINNT